MAETARQQAGLSIKDLWLRYFALGGKALPAEVAAYLADAASKVPDENVLAHAITERFWEMGLSTPFPTARTRATIN